MNVTRRIGTVAVAGVLMLSAAACSGGGEADGDAAASVAAAASFSVSLLEFAISPETVHAPAGRA